MKPDRMSSATWTQMATLSTPELIVRRRAGGRNRNWILVAKCNGCGTQVVWCPNDETGKRAPVDVMTSTDGNVVVYPNGSYHVLTDAEKLDPSTPTLRRTLHFATCPKKEHFRRCGKCHHDPCRCPKQGSLL